MASALLLFRLCVPAHTHDLHPCAAAFTARTAAQPLPVCGVEYASEQSLLASSCLEDADTQAGLDGAVVCLAMRKRWWLSVRAMLPLVADTAERSHVRQAAQRIKDGAAAVLRSVQSSGDDVPVVVPAVQWAQDSASLRVLVRFSPKKHGPVSVAAVHDSEVNMNATSVAFRARARGKQLHFSLLLDLARAIVPEQSSYSLASAGRLTMVLAKVEAVSWQDLCRPADAASARRGHVGRWYEMQEMLDAQPRASNENGGKRSTPAAPEEGANKGETSARDREQSSKDKAKNKKLPQFQKMQRQLVRWWKLFLRWCRLVWRWIASTFSRLSSLSTSGR